MSAQPEAAQALGPVARAFRALGIPFFVGGSLASSAHGLPRSSVDADLVAELRPGQGRALEGELGPDFYLDGEAAELSIAQGTSFNAIHVPTMFKIDVFPMGAAAHDREEFARLRPGRIGDLELPLCSAEDIVLRKLQWFRKGGEVSERQWKDVLGVLRVGEGALDLGYMRRWAPALGIRDLLERAIAEGGRPV